LSKSRRKTPIIGVGGSGKGIAGETRWRKERTAVREKLARGDYDLLEFTLFRFDEWSTNRDGKVYVSLQDILTSPRRDFYGDTDEEIEIWYRKNILGK